MHFIKSPFHSLTVLVKSFAGRKNTGRICRFNRGRRFHRRYRTVDFRFIIWNTYIVILRTEHDPFRNALICLVCYPNGILSYVLNFVGFIEEVEGISLYIGSFLEELYYRIGDVTNLMTVPEGMNVSTVEYYPTKGGKIARTSATSAIYIKKYGPYSLIRMPSKRNYYMLSNSCICTLGTVTNLFSVYINASYYKAGQLLYRGRKPTVRGVAKNPVDHPHGGGEGRTSGGRPSVTPNSLPARKRKTRKNYRKIMYKFLIIKPRIDALDLDLKELGFTAVVI